MITPAMIARINELARKSKGDGLNDSEKTEQTELRRLYVDAMKAKVKAGLDAAKAEAHPHSCDCGCHDKH